MKGQVRLRRDGPGRSLWEGNIQLVVNDKREAVHRELEGGRLMCKEQQARRS